MKILFFSPTGARTGSEMVLWYLMKQLADSQIQTAIYTGEAGELFLNESPTKHTFQYKKKRNFLNKIIETVVHKLTGKTPEQWYVQRIHKKFKPDFWYLNTVSMNQFAALAQKLNVPYILHVHEMISVFDTLQAHGFAKMLNHSKMTICCSAAVEKQFKDMGAANVKLLHEFVDTEKINVNTSAKDIRKRLNIPDDSYVWLMSGTICMRKGIDFIPDLLNHLPKDTYLVWLGSESEYSAYYYVKKRTELEHLNFIVLGNKGGNDYYDYLNLCDGFVLLSREDPFPLVMIEAAYLQKPIVGFESGGVAEFVVEGMGKVVPAFDVALMAESMQQIMTKQLKIDASVLRNRALEFDVKTQAKKWQKLIETLTLN